MTRAATTNTSNGFYRVSVRALIINEKREILLVDEKDRGWDIPGGGLDWGEDPLVGLQRELKEELGCTGTSEPLPALVTTWSNTRTGQHLLWLMYRVTIDITAIVPTDQVGAYRFFSYQDYRQLDNHEVEWQSSTDYFNDLELVLKT